MNQGISDKRGTRRQVLLAVLVALTLAAACFAGGGLGSDVQRAEADSAKQLVKDADKLIRRGKLDEAEKLLKRAVEVAGALSFPRLRLAALYVKQRRLLEAYELAFPVAKAEPKNHYAFAVLGSTMLAAGRFEDAKLLYFTSIKLNRRQGYAWAGYGLLDFYENRITESLNNLQQAVFNEPDQPDYYFALAQVSARAERYREAADAYHRFLLLSRDTDDERRARIKGLISFLKFLGDRDSLYVTGGAEKTVVPIAVVGNRPVIQVKINGEEQPLNFVLDTGSGISVISEETAKRLDIDPITKGGYAKGIGGEGKFEIVYGFVRQVRIGDVEVRNVPVYIRRFHNDGPRADGYIGLSLISKFLTTLDYGEKTFALSKGPQLPAADASGSVALPLRLTSSGFLSGEVQVGGVENSLNFIVDTGASISVISDEVANMDSILPFVNAEKMRVVGSAGVTDGVKSFRLPSVTFGQHSRKDVTAIALDLDMINEASGFEQAGILGGNFLMNYRLTFDFKNSKVTFLPVAARQ